MISASFSSSGKIDLPITQLLKIDVKTSAHSKAQNCRALVEIEPLVDLPGSRAKISLITISLVTAFISNEEFTLTFDLIAIIDGCVAYLAIADDTGSGSFAIDSGLGGISR